MAWLRFLMLGVSILREIYYWKVYIDCVPWKWNYFFQEDNEGACEGDDAGLMKRLNKQRQKAIAAARGGRRAIASRNSYKDKGSKSSHNAKIQKQLNQWWSGNTVNSNFVKLAKKQAGLQT